MCAMTLIYYFPFMDEKNVQTLILYRDHRGMEEEEELDPNCTQM